MESSHSKLMTPDNNAFKMKEKNQHIQVFVRVRPMNTQEKAKHSLTVLDCPGNKEVVVKERTMNNLTKTFTFDKVFGPNSKQIDVYKSVVAPLLEEVLLGYNCTVFAYGQTGTGKTFTMEGDRSPDSGLSWDKDPLSGIVPRALNQLFDELRVQGVEFTVRVSLLELYNEELFDLLAPTEDMKLKTLRLFEDTARKGSVIIQGLEEVTVHNKHEVYDIMEKGSLRRQTASTLMNDKSSRSHTVFTVTVHIKECNLDGEELLKIGKLHLVDLAGSENIGRSGAVDKRAREAGSINQSLLTLGRVITSLVERAPHVPYRESKLTRLLQDSLGGRTKTSIIATVSPASINLEETLSTLDYAHRAKNITNRPEINQKLTKKAMLKAYTEEIEQLKKDLQATREKNGVFIDKSNYERMMTQLESQGQDIAERITIVKSLEESLEKKEEELTGTKAILVETQEDLNAANAVINTLNEDLKITQLELRKVKQERDEKGHLVSKHLETENKLSSEAHVLLKTANTTTVNLENLYSKLERKKRVEESNLDSGRRFRRDLADRLILNMEDVQRFRNKHNKMYGLYSDDLVTFAETKEREFEMLKEELKAFSDDFKIQLENLHKVTNLQAYTTEKWTDNLPTSIEKDQKNQVEHFEKFLCQSQCTASETYKHFCSMQETYNSTLTKALKQCSYMDDEVKTFTENLVESMKSSVDYITVYVLQHDDQLKQIKSDALASKVSADAFHDSMKKSIVAFQTELASMLLKNEEFKNGTEEAKIKTLQQTDALQAKTEDFAAAVIDQIAYREDLVSVYKKQNNDECSKLNEDLDEEKNEFMSKFDSAKQTLSLHNKETEEAVTEGQKLLGEMCNRLGKESKELSEVTSDLNGEIKYRLNNIGSTVETEVVKLEGDAKINLGMDKKNALQIKGDINDGMTIVSDWAENKAEEISQQLGMVSEYFDSTYLVDLPTGATPQRKVYQYPITLSATSPHEAILNRFRKNRKVSTPSSLGKLYYPDQDEGSAESGLTDEATDGSSSCSSVTSVDSKENPNASPTENIVVEVSTVAQTKLANTTQKLSSQDSVTQTPKIANKENALGMSSKSGKPKTGPAARNFERRDGAPSKGFKKGNSKDILQVPN